MGATYGVLGEIELRHDGVRVELGHLRQRSVLAVLLMESGNTVTAAELVDRVWGEHPPRQALNSLYAYLSRLRRALQPEADLLKQSGGYLVAATPDAVDVHQFRALLTQARTTDARTAADLMEQALGLWRKEAFAGIDTPWFNAQRALLDNERTAAQLDLVDLQLSQGDHQRLLPELQSRAQANPLDERVAGQLMVALQGAGRTADGLAEFHRIRLALNEELGIDPSPALHELQRQLLNTGDSAGVAPRQLPRAPGNFSGRKQAVDQLTEALTTADPQQPAISTISGTGGIGKTSLALHWAHRNLALFPDGQLFVDLRGFDPADEPVSTDVALGGLLQALGAASIPADLQARAGLYRTLIADKRMLVLLDNASGSRQVTPLLPGTPSCKVVVTSRRRLGGLVTQQAATPIDLDVLDPDEARELLAQHVGRNRLTAEPEAFGELLAHCGGLPLALAIVAARAASMPSVPLEALAEELRDSEVRLDALDTGELDAGLRTVFHASYRALDYQAAQLFALLGLAPGPDIGVPAVAGLADLPVAEVRTILQRLETANLIRQHAPGRYQLHDLVRLYALEQAQRMGDHQQEAMRRLVDHYLHTAQAADYLLTPGRAPQELPPPAKGARAVELPDRTEAAEWLDTEHDCLVAVQRLAQTQGWHDAVWQLAWQVVPYQTRHALIDGNLLVWGRALAVVPAIDDPSTASTVHRFYGRSRSMAGRHDEAWIHLHKALEFAEASGDPLLTAHALQAVTAACERRGDYELGLRYALEQVEVYRAHGKPIWLADALGFVGWMYVRLERYEDSRPWCEEALRIYRSEGYTDGEADVLDTIGRAAHQAGDYPRAVATYQQALALFLENHNHHHEVDTLEHLGQTHLAMSNNDLARGVWQEALEVAQEQQRTEVAARLQEQLAALG